MERIGIYTGTFNPIHLGHLRGARYALDELRLDRVLMIPDGITPHKTMTPDSPTGEQRLHMLRLCLDGETGIQCTDMAMNREGTTYTWQVVEQIREDNPEAELFLLLGSDMLENFHQWRGVEFIIKNTCLAVLCRGEKDEMIRLRQKQEELRAMGAEVLPLDNLVTAISSTQLRRMLVFHCAGEFIPERVREFIYGKGLYGTGRDYRNLPIEELERTVVSLLKANRVNHVLGCRQAAVELAGLYGADETDAARAALLHDITKALDGPLQLTLCREYGTMLDDFSTGNPKTLHALTGSLVAERIFGENEAVVDAIRCHTTGKADMNLLEKIIYVADYMEPNRDFPGVEALRRLAYTDITKALEMGLEMTLAMLNEQHREVSPESQEALRFLHDKRGVL